MGHFGHGVLTWPVPCLFRTDPGWNLLVRGPSNLFKDGIVPLDGLVETDWTPATFTMNWRFTRPCTVRWDAGEPYGMIVPQRRDELESFAPRFVDGESGNRALSEHREWAESRAQFLVDLKSGDREATKRGWQRDYFSGLGLSGHIAATHRTMRRLRPFRRQDSTDE
jgi:hypothetical protein